MRYKLLAAALVIVLILFGIFVFNWSSKRYGLSDKDNVSQYYQNLTGAEISRLENGVFVKFPATLVKGTESGCLDLFVQDDFRKFNGDKKYAIRSQLANNWWQSFLIGGGINAVVKGKMVFVKNAEDPSQTCGIIAGQIFEIAEIEYF